MAYTNVCISKNLKEGLGWAIDKWLRITSNKMFSYTTKKLKDKALKQYCMRCYVVLSNVF